MKKILILEDEDALGRIYKKKLEKSGYDVFWVTTAREVKEYIKTFSADIILLDHGLRGEEESGLDLLPIIKKELPNVHVFMLSNYSHTDLEAQSRKAGAEGYFVKIDTPPSRLIEELQRVIGQENENICPIS